MENQFDKNCQLMERETLFPVQVKTFNLPDPLDFSCINFCGLHAGSYRSCQSGGRCLSTCHEIYFSPAKNSVGLFPQRNKTIESANKVLIALLKYNCANKNYFVSTKITLLN